MLAELTSDEVTDRAYAWLIRQRRDWPADTDIWDLRFHWGRDKRRIQAALRQGDYRFAPLSRVTKADGEIVHVWSSRDALVLKALAIVLAKSLPVSARCTHVKGHGGSKAAVRAVRAHLGQNAFVKGFDFLGYHFDGSGMSVAQATVERFMEHATRLYEQERREPDGHALLGPYVRRWSGWVGGGFASGELQATPQLVAENDALGEPHKQKPRRSGVCVSAVELTQAAAASFNFFLRPTQPSNPKPSPIIA